TPTPAPRTISGTARSAPRSCPGTRPSSAPAGPTQGAAPPRPRCSHSSTAWAVPPPPPPERHAHTASPPASTATRHRPAADAQRAANQMGLGKGLQGIEVNASNVLIGGGSGQGNTIIFTRGSGVAVEGNVVSVQILENTFGVNGTGSISLVGANGLQNAPVLT